MIVEMSKIQVVVTAADKQKLLDELHNRGGLHIVPVDPAAAIADEQVAQKYDNAAKAIASLSDLPEASPADCDTDPEEIISSIVEAQKTIDDCVSKTGSLKRLIENQKAWGDVTLADFKELKDAGLYLSFFIVPDGANMDVDAEFITQLEGSAGKQITVVVSSAPISLPEGSAIEPVSLPETDNVALKAELQELGKKSLDALEKVKSFTPYLAVVKNYYEKLSEKHEFSKAANGGLNDTDLFAIQGWVPSADAGSLAGELDKAGIPCGMRVVEPDEKEVPPTEIAYPEWTKPIKGLFGVLGTLPGYNEPELSKFFMVAFPFFAAMIIGDGGYGLIFMALAFGMRKKLVEAAGKDMADLIKVIGIGTFIWGVISGNFFGVSPASFGLDESGNPMGFGKLMALPAIFWRADSEAGVALLTKFCFFVGCTHLILAHLCQAIFIWPDKRAISEIGWCVVLIAMLGLIWSLFYPDALLIPMNIVMILLLIGLAMVIIFTHPAKNPIVRVLIGFASSLLPTIGAFGDTMSYIRLMAVGLASYYLAVAFNQMGTEMFDSGLFGVIFGCIVIVFGHVLNIILAIIAVLAHGVRLNMLEFSGGAGIQWGGYAYEPFGNKK